jgi:uncharacterized membrane protein YeaQ/YmgE (transglycosylase-associated protein family)
VLVVAVSAGRVIAEVIVLVVVGLIIGALGRLIHPGPDPLGLVATTAIGVVSLVIAGLLLPRAIGAFGYLVAVLIAVLLVALVSNHRRRRSA